MVLRTVMEDPVLQSDTYTWSGVCRLQVRVFGLRTAQTSSRQTGLQNWWCQGALERVGAARLHLVASLALPNADSLTLHRVLHGEEGL